MADENEPQQAAIMQQMLAAAEKQTELSEERTKMAADRSRMSADRLRISVSSKRFDNNDPALGAFLDLLEQDVGQGARQLRPFDAKLARKIQPLVDNIEINMEAALPDEDEWPAIGKNDC